MTVRIALVGDRRKQVVAHRAIPETLSAIARGGRPVPWEWIATERLAGAAAAERLAPFDAVWCVPGSPYASTEGALAAIRFARESGRAFLGTCGGFQHALMEYARACWGIASPAHAEIEPEAADPLITPLACSLVGEVGEVRIAAGSRLARVYGSDRAIEAYHCSYGVNPAHAARLASGPLRAVAHDANGEIRAVELSDHPFFVATLYQPERAILSGRVHPLVAALVAAAARRS